jgi:hypothetical protein
MRERLRPVGFIGSAGFTLVIGLPYFSSMIKGSRLDGATRRLVGDVREARSRATLTGWQYKILGFKYGGGGANPNQYRIVGRSSTSVAWPSDTAQSFQSATQMAGAWIDVSPLVVTSDAGGSMSVTVTPAGGVKIQ